MNDFWYMLVLACVLALLFLKLGEVINEAISITEQRNICWENGYFAENRLDANVVCYRVEDGNTVMVNPTALK